MFVTAVYFAFVCLYLTICLHTKIFEHVFVVNKSVDFLKLDQHSVL